MRSRWRTVAVAPLVAVALVLSGCATSKRPAADAQSFEPASPDPLVAAAERTGLLDYRYRTVLSVEGGTGVLADLGPVLDAGGLGRALELRGTISGDDRSLHVRTSLVAGLLDGVDGDLPLDPVGLQVEARLIDGTWYVRAPRTLLIAALQEIGARLPADSDVLDQLVSGWVRIDADGSTEALDEISRWVVFESAALQRVLDPVDLLQALTEADEVTAADGTFDDEEVTVYRGTVALEPHEPAEPDASPGSTPGDASGVRVLVEVAVGEDGTVRSASYGVTMHDLLELAGGVGLPDDDASFDDLRQVVRTTFSDVGAAELEIEAPAVYETIALDGES